MFDAGQGGTLLQPLDEGFNRRSRALDVAFDAFTRQIADPSMEAKRFGVSLREIAVSDALHAAADEEAGPYCFARFAFAYHF